MPKTINDVGEHYNDFVHGNVLAILHRHKARFHLLQHSQIPRVLDAPIPCHPRLRDVGLHWWSHGTYSQPGTFVWIGLAANLITRLA